MGHADEAYDLWRYADELPEASRFADDAVRRVDDLADSRRYGDDVAKNLDCPLRNSFSADTSVLTAAGEVAISEIAVGDLVLAYNEATGETGYYTVTAVISHVDPSIVELTIDSDPSASSGTETLETTAEHPFYVVAGAPWLQSGETQGRWVNAGELEVGDAVRQADGTTGMVQAVVVVERRQPMYNLTVADAHTFFVGDGEWLVHNQSPKCVPGKGLDYEIKSPKPVKPTGAVDEWEKFLGQGPYSNTHPRTGVPDPDRIVSADGNRSIRYGDHEMNSPPNKHHYHEETWVYDAIRDVMDVFNTLVRVPLK